MLTMAGQCEAHSGMLVQYKLIMLELYGVYLHMHILIASLIALEILYSTNNKHIDSA
jgi:hypothetical protein